MKTSEVRTALFRVNTHAAEAAWRSLSGLSGEAPLPQRFHLRVLVALGALTADEADERDQHRCYSDEVADAVASV